MVNNPLPLLSKEAKVHKQTLEAQAAAAMDIVAEANATPKSSQVGASNKKRPAACAKRPAAQLEVQGSPAKKRHQTMPKAEPAERLEKKACIAPGIRKRNTPSNPTSEDWQMAFAGSL